MLWTLSESCRNSLRGLQIPLICTKAFRPFLLVSHELGTEASSPSTTNNSPHASMSTPSERREEYGRETRRLIEELNDPGSEWYWLRQVVGHCHANLARHYNFYRSREERRATQIQDAREKMASLAEENRKMAIRRAIFVEMAKNVREAQEKLKQDRAQWAMDKARWETARQEFEADRAIWEKEKEHMKAVGKSVNDDDDKE